MARDPVNFHVMYLDARKTTPARLAWDWLRTLGGSETSVAHAVDHVERVIEVAGPDHVGLGSDFDGTPFVPSGVAHVGEFPSITAELLRRGHAEEEIREILGENLLRVLARAEGLGRRP